MAGCMTSVREVAEGDRHRLLAEYLSQTPDEQARQRRAAVENDADLDAAPVRLDEPAHAEYVAQQPHDPALPEPRLYGVESLPDPDQHVMGEGAEQCEDGLSGGALLPPAVDADALL